MTNKKKETKKLKNINTQHTRLVYAEPAPASGLAKFMRNMTTKNGTMYIQYLDRKDSLPAWAPFSFYRLRLCKRLPTVSCQIGSFIYLKNLVDVEYVFRFLLHSDAFEFCSSYETVNQINNKSFLVLPLLFFYKRNVTFPISRPVIKTTNKVKQKVMKKA